MEQLDDDRTAARLVEALAGESEELARLTLDLAALPDLSGFERPVAEAVEAWFRRAGIEASLQPLSETSANVIGRIGPADPRPLLILSSHLDTEGAPPVGDDDERRQLRGAWRDGDLLVGKGLVNDRTQLAAMLVALRAVGRLDLPLRAPIGFLGTAQECGAPVEDRPLRRDEGPHMHEGTGARWAVRHGLAADAVLVGEPTGFAISAAQAGYLRVRITVPGSIPYTPFVERGDGPLDTANPFERAGEVLRRLTAWARAFERRERFDFPLGTVAPKAQVQDVRRTAPLFTQADDPVDVYLDIRTRPGNDDDRLLAELHDLLADLPFACAVSAYDRATGFVATGADHLVAAVDRAHRRVFGSPPARPRDPQVSMWHDTNAFNEAGIPAVSYGILPQPEPFTRERFRAARVDDLVRLAQVYGLTALGLAQADLVAEPGAGTASGG